METRLHETRLQEDVSSWRVMGRSIRGASHVRAGVPNQDAIKWLEAGPRGGLLAAVADGHGSPKCWRSHHGSRFAVDAAQEVVGEFLEQAWDRSALEALPGQLVRNWRGRVEDHLRQDPLTTMPPHEWEKRAGRAARTALDANPWMAYGTTLLVTAVTDGSALYLQLGDGDILTVSPDAQVSRPWGHDQRWLGNETTSLAAPNAADEMRVRLSSGADSLPELILLSTDGYANSFREDDGFLAVGEDLIRMIRLEGIGPVEENLESWLQEASELGSGDDVTVGMLWRELPSK
jgi:hypothetical protein